MGIMAVNRRRGGEGFMRKSSMAVIGLFFLLYIVPLGVRPIIIPDESRYAEIPREMIASSDWIVPRLNGLRYFEKPVLGYWINAGSMMLFGDNAFAIRLPSALAAGISALILFFPVRRFSGGHSTGLFAAAIFLTCLGVFGVGTFNVLDSLLSLFITAAMASFFFAHMEDRSGKKTGLLALSGIFCGLAFLTKGFIAFAVPLVAIVPFMIWERQWKELFQVCWIPFLTAVLISLPWSVMIHIREPDFWLFFIWNEHIKRFIAENAQHYESFWYFLLILPGVALPWTFLLPAAASGLKQARFNTPIIRFALCWFLFPFLFFSFSNGKLLTYILPCFPSLAILIEIGLHNYFQKGKTRAFTIGALLLALATAILAVALLVLQISGFHGFKPYVETWKWVLAVAGLLSWTMFLLFSLRKSEHQKKIMLYAAAPILFMFVAHVLLPDLTIEHKAPGEFLLRHSHRIRPETILVSDEEPVRAVCWFYRRSDVYLLGTAGELSYGLHFEDSKHRLLNPDQFREFVHKNRGKGRVTLIAKAWKYRNWKQNLPEPLFEDSNGNGGFIFAQF